MLTKSTVGFLAVSALLLLLLNHSWFGPDIWYHLFWGRDLLENGNWIPQPPVLISQPIPANGYWLFQAVLYITYSIGGIFGVSALFATFWLLIAWLWLRITRLDTNPLGTLVFLAFVLCMQLRFEHRPEVISYLLITFFIFASEKAFTEKGIAPKWMAALVMAQIIWTNCHGYFVFGPIIVAVMAWRGVRRVEVGAALAIGGFALTLASPFGYRVWESVALYARLGRGTADYNAELFSPPLWPLFLPNGIFWIAWLVVALLVVYAIVKKRDPWAAVLAVAGLGLGAQAIRNMPLLFLFSPLIWRQLPQPRIGVTYARMFAILVVVVAVGLSGAVVSGYYHDWVGSLATFGVKLEWSSYPIGAVDHLQSSQFKGNLFVDSYDGGYTEYHLSNAKISGDSYFSDPDLTTKFFALIRSPEALNKFDSQVQFDGFVINIENLDVMNSLLNRSDLVVTYADSHRAVFKKRALVPQAKGDLSAFSYYHGEDLRHWAYAFGTVSWMGLAAQRQDAGLVRKILADVGTAPHVPDVLLRIALKFALDRRDEEVVRMLAAIKDRLDGQ